MDFSPERIDLPENKTRMAQKSLPGWCQRNTLAVAMKQPGAEVLLKIFDTVAGGGK